MIDTVEFQRKFYEGGIQYDHKENDKFQLRILAIDDEEIMGYVIKRIVGCLGYDLDWVSTCEHALKKIQEEQYDVILSDFKLPNMSGDILYQKIQQLDNRLLDKLVFITGDTVNHHTMNFFRRTKVPYLTKPFDMQDLKMMIHKVAIDSDS